MLDGLKNLFGAKMNPLDMIKPMLPKLMQDAEPKLLSAYHEKALKLAEQAGGLRNDETVKEEIAAYLVVRKGQLVLQWAILCHARNEQGVWAAHIGEVLQTVTLQDVFKTVQEDLRQKQLPETTEAEFVDFKPTPIEGASALPPHQPETPGDMVTKAIDAEHLHEVSEKLRQTNPYELQRYVVVKIEESYEVIEGPAPECETVYYGHQDEDIAQNWATAENRKAGN